MPPPLLTLYTTSWEFFFLCWEREGKEVSKGETGIRPGELRHPPAAPSAQLWAPPQPASSLRPAQPA